MVEYQLPKLDAAGSSPAARCSYFAAKTRRHKEMRHASLCLGGLLAK
jgi:hypothetical protein